MNDKVTEFPGGSSGGVFPREEAHALLMMVAASSSLDSAAMVIKNADIKNRFRQFEREVRQMIASASTGSRGQ